MGRNIVFWHFLSVTLFIGYELRVIFLAGTNASVFDLIIFYTCDILFFYVSSYWYLPYVQTKHRHFVGKVLWYAIWVLFFSFIFLGLTYALTSFHGKDIAWEGFKADLYRSVWRRMFLFSIALGYWYARYSIAREREVYLHRLQLAEARENAAKQESALLRAQVNPHLMFNALNGIYGQLSEKSPETARIALLLSDMMAFAIMEPEEGRGYTLGDELAQMERLVELHRLLNEGQIHIDVDIHIPEAAMDISFPPLLIVNLVDNLFKHGDLKDRAWPARIGILYESGALHVVLSNRRMPVAGNVGKRGLGLGIRNTRRRLEKHYPGKYTFSTSPDGYDEFVVQLYIKLNV